MKILEENTIKELNQLIEMEVEIINKSFSVSQELGLVMLNNSINSFVELHLKAKYGDVKLSMCSEYRVFIVGLVRTVDEKYQDAVVSELLIPKIKTFNDEELLKILSSFKHKDEKNKNSLTNIVKRMIGTKVSINEAKPSNMSEESFENYIELSNILTCDTCGKWMNAEQNSYSGNYCPRCLSKV